MMPLSPFSSLYPTSLFTSSLPPFPVLSNFSSLSHSLYLLFLPSTHSIPFPFTLPFLPFIHLPLYSLPSSNFYFLSLPTIPLSLNLLPFPLSLLSSGLPSNHYKVKISFAKIKYVTNDTFRYYILINCPTFTKR
jgi:hypothetical protein